MSINYLCMFIFLITGNWVYSSFGQQELESLNRNHQISLRTLEKRIRENQEEVASLQDKISDKALQLSRLNLDYQKRNSGKESGISRDKRKMLSLLQLSLSDPDSLESLGEQAMLIEKYKRSKILKEKISEADKSSNEKIKSLSNDLRALRNLELKSLTSLKNFQRQKVDILSQVEVNKLQINNTENQEQLADTLQSPAGGWLKSAEKTMFVEPVKGYIKYNKEDKGLGFECLDMCNVIAPATGHVVYSGDLAPYGKILMIAHSQGYRSVFLGDMQVNVKKSQKVYQGRLIAKVVKRPLAKIYFELRKDSKTQDIFDFISFL